MDILECITLLTQSIGFGANVFSIFYSPIAIALYLFGFAIFTINRLVIGPIIGRASSDMARKATNKKSSSSKKG